MTTRKLCEWGSLACALWMLGSCTVRVGNEGSSGGKDAESGVDDGDAAEQEASSTGPDSDKTDGKKAAVRASSSAEDTGNSANNEGSDDEDMVDRDGARVQDEMVVPDAMASTPRYLQAECGTIAPSDVPVSSSRGAPTDFAPGELVGGRLDPSSTSNQEHYWQTVLTKGFYHVVVDTARSDGRGSNIGIDLELLDEDGAKQLSLFHGNEIAKRYRDAAFIEIEEDTTVGLRVRPVHGMEDYLFGVFDNGTAVPSPRFVKCPTITPLAVGEATSFALGAEGSDTEEVWFAVEFAAGDYQFEVESAQADGKDTNLQYGLYDLDRFAQKDRAITLVFVNEIDTSFLSKLDLAVGERGPHYIRFVNSHHELDMTVTISAK